MHFYFLGVLLEKIDGLFSDFDVHGILFSTRLTILTVFLRDKSLLLCEGEKF